MALSVLVSNVLQKLLTRSQTLGAETVLWSRLCGSSTLETPDIGTPPSTASFSVTILFLASRHKHQFQQAVSAWLYPLRENIGSSTHPIKESRLGPFADFFRTILLCSASKTGPPSSTLVRSIMGGLGAPCCRAQLRRAAVLLLPSAHRFHLFICLLARHARNYGLSGLDSTPPK